MIVSIHIPKTAGTTFRELLYRDFGERLFQDYGDLAGYRSPEADALRARRKLEIRARRDELMRNFDVIHGHFIADKYIGLFPKSDFVAFF